MDSTLRDWFKASFRFAQQQTGTVQFDDSALKEAINSILQRYRSILESEHELAAQPLNAQEYAAKLHQALGKMSPAFSGQLQGFVGNVISLISTNPKAAKDAADDLLMELSSPAWRKNQMLEWSNVRELYRVLVDLEDHLRVTSNPPQPIDQQVAEYNRRLHQQQVNAVAGGTPQQAPLRRCQRDQNLVIFI